MAAALRVMSSLPGLLDGKSDGAEECQPDDYLAARCSAAQNNHRFGPYAIDAPRRTTRGVPQLLYTQATGEVIFIALAVSWIVTYFYNPAIIESNPLKDRLGYNNPCVGWDEPPSLYIAAFMLQAAVLFACRYCVLDLVRAQRKRASGEISSGVFKILRLAHVLYILGMFLLPMIFIVTPTVSPEWHTSAYGTIILFRFIVVASNFIENRGELCDENISKAKWAFIYIYGVVSIVLMACLFTNFYYYKGNEEAYARDERPIPTKIGMFVDYSWFVCLALTGKFLPTCYVLQITYKNIPTDKK